MPADAPIRVLVADGHHTARELAVAILRTAGMDVASVASAGSTLERASATLPSVLVLELVLDGERDGWDVLEGLRGDPDTARIPVLVCTTVAGRSTEHRALAAGASAFLPKPYLPDVLESAVRDLAAGIRPPVGSHPREHPG